MYITIIMIMIVITITIIIIIIIINNKNNNNKTLGKILFNTHKKDLCTVLHLKRTKFVP